MDSRPNILLIMPDQMRGDCLSLERHPVLLTPNVDELGGRGVFFRRAYSTCASCIPARRSLLTGLFPYSGGVVGFRDGRPIESPTFPKLFSDAGYHTVLVGRHMHQYPHEEPYGYGTLVLGSTYVGRDEYSCALEKEAPDSGGVKGHGISFNGWTAKPWHLAEYLHPTNWIVGRSREVLSRHPEDRPILLTTSFYAPHPPLIPPAFYMDRYLRSELPGAAIGDWAVPPENDGLGLGVEFHRVCLKGEALRAAQAGYFGLINQIDDQIFWLIAEFRQKSWRGRRPWIILFTSDHGEMLGDHHYFRKCEPYEGSSRIPLLIQGSADLGFRAGHGYVHPVCLEDIMPTLLELAGIESPAPADGKSLVTILRGGTAPVRPWLHAEHSPCYSVGQAYHLLTDGRMKYIWRPHDGSEQLFDLDRDPGELHDLSREAEREQELAPWRSRLVEQLKGRPEGFTDGKRLVAGRNYDAFVRGGDCA